MGTKHSFPIPKEEDFQPTPGAPKKQTSTLGNSLTKMDLRFTIPQHIWDKKTGTTTEITGLGLKFVVADDKHLEMRLVDTDELVVVLQEPTKSGHPLQICVISQPTPEAPVMGKWQDYTLYEYATVDKIRDSRQHVLRITADANATGTVWRTDACGSRRPKRDNARQEVHPTQLAGLGTRAAPQILGLSRRGWCRSFAHRLFCDLHGSLETFG